MGQIPGEGQGLLCAGPTPRAAEESLTEMLSQHLEKEPSRCFKQGSFRSDLSGGAALSRAMVHQQGQAGENW